MYENPYHISHWLADIEFDFHGGLLNILHTCDTNESRKPYVYVAYVEYRPVEGYAITEQRESISRILQEQNICHAIAQTMGGSLILADQPFDFNPLIFKLTTGTDIGKGQAFDFNSFLEKHELQETYRKLYRTGE